MRTQTSATIDREHKKAQVQLRADGDAIGRGQVVHADIGRRDRTRASRAEPTIGRIAAEATVGLGASGGWRGPYGEKDRALGLHGSDSMGHSGHMRGRTAQAGAGQAAYPAHAHARCRGVVENATALSKPQAKSDGEQR